ncbi:dCTP deaminase domain-containing protein [Methylorubrum populi]|nr:hypothetical protein [Methylorubrum populi]
MSFWSSETWISASKIHEYVHRFDKKNLSDGAYKLSLGSEAIVSSGYSELGSENAYRRLSPTEDLKLLPGQYAYLITEERVQLTTGVLGFINASTGIKLKGLINVSGFHVDPGYNGKLIFTVFNAGPTPITLHQGQQIFRLWLSDFRGQGSVKKEGYDSLPRDLADRLHGTYPSPFALSARLNELKDEINVLRTDLGKQKDDKAQLGWYVLIAAIFLLPFVASLYTSMYGVWFGDRMKDYLESSRAKLTNTEPPVRKQQDAAPPAPLNPPATSPAPAANNPTTDAKQDESAQPKGP